VLKVIFPLIILCTTYSAIELGAAPGFTGCPAGLQEEEKQLANEVDVRITPLKNVIAPGDTLPLRVEIWNIGTQNLYICKNWDTFGAACRLDLSFDPLAKTEHGSITEDCVPYEWLTHPSLDQGSFADILTKDWVLISPGHFYGGIMELKPGSYPELGEVGRYRISGRYSSGDLLEANCYYKFKPFAKEVERLSASPGTAL
jgi:hypothetical protein